VWSIDITYIKMRHGHLYLTAIIDWYSRMVVGWKLSDTLDTACVLQAVTDAVAAHGYPAILNSDQGCQFTSAEYKALLKRLHITQSMDGKSRWADNIMIERWFRNLKTEEINLNEYETPRALRQAIRAYVQQYNAVRPHQALGNRTPEAMYYASFPVHNADLDGLRQAG
jgi:putative transposase